jgi:hypothetical protein
MTMKSATIWDDINLPTFRRNELISSAARFHDVHFDTENEGFTFFLNTGTHLVEILLVKRTLE